MNKRDSTLNKFLTIATVLSIIFMIVVDIVLNTINRNDFIGIINEKFDLLLLFGLILFLVVGINKISGFPVLEHPIYKVIISFVLMTVCIIRIYLFVTFMPSYTIEDAILHVKDNSNIMIDQEPEIYSTMPTRPPINPLLKSVYMFSGLEEGNKVIVYFNPVNGEFSTVDDKFQRK